MSEMAFGRHPFEVQHVEQTATPGGVLERVTGRVLFLLLLLLTRHQNVAELHFALKLFELLEEIGLLLLCF